MNKPENQFAPDKAFVDVTKQPEPTLSDGPIDGSRYWSKEFMDKEWDHMWTKVWLIAGLESQIPNEGDFFTFEMGRESFICTRDSEGKIRVFYNVCQHRGNLLIHEPHGNAKYLTCKYHGWRYRPDGTLAWAPCAEDFSQGNPAQCGGKADLEELPCEVFAGLVWYTMDKNAKPLSDYLGPIMNEIAVYRMEDMVRTHWVTVEGDFNWKCVQDNFNESYHLPFVHPQTKYTMEQSYKYCQFDMFEAYGHARMF
ncbi:MAG: aromatic ring-hydroxylating dioxygenase subunit alpha, partial [Pseudomonadota bacterium]